MRIKLHLSRKIIGHILLLSAMGTLLTQCNPKKDLDVTGVQGTFSSIYTNVLSKNCVGCHSPGGAGPTAGSDLDFSNQSTSYQSLKNGSVKGYSANGSGQCNNVYLVQSGQPQSSYLLATLYSDYYKTDFVRAGCDPYQPSGHGATVGADEKNAMVKWIQNGAAND